jgi:hypothetical protein
LAEVNHCEAPEYTALIHTVNEIGVHRAIIINRLAEPSLRAVLSLESIQDGAESYSGLAEIDGTAWIDFPELNRGNDWVERMETNTHLALREHAGSKEDFVTAELIVASIIHSRKKGSPSARLPEAHLNYLTRIQPDESITDLPPYVASWLPAFLRLDRPHPPMSASRTDAIRNIASFRP